jgi:hypothetical protein
MTAALRRQRLVQHLHRLGERAVDELLVELGLDYRIEVDILLRLERYGRVSPAIVRAFGAANLPSPEFLAIDRSAA